MPYLTLDPNISIGQLIIHSDFKSIGRFELTLIMQALGAGCQSDTSDFSLSSNISVKYTKAQLQQFFCIFKGGTRQEKIDIIDLCLCRSACSAQRVLLSNNLSRSQFNKFHCCVDSGDHQNF